MKTLLIVFYSLTGGTRQMAEAAARGAVAESGVHVRLLHALEAEPADVLTADGYIFATPENLAAIAGLMKDFFDRTYYAALERINGRPYATLIGTVWELGGYAASAQCRPEPAAGSNSWPRPDPSAPL